MHRTQWVELWRMIRATKTVFFTIILVSAVALGTYTGIDFCTDSVKMDCEDYFNEYQLFDLQFGCTMGFSEQKMAMLRGNEAIAQAESAYSVQTLLRLDGESYAVEVHTAPGTLNRIALVEGRFPERAGECVIEESTREKFGLQLGDTLCVSSNALTMQELTVVGSGKPVTVFCNNILYNRGTSKLANGQITAKILVSEESFAEELLPQVCYAVLRERIPRSSRMYESLTKELKKQLSASLAELEQQEYNAAADALKQEYDTLVQEYTEGHTETEEKLLALAQRVQKLGFPRVYVGGISSNPSYAYYTQFADATQTVVSALCSLLLAIAILVCYTVISRMVTEQHRIIGTQKAIGMRSREIFSKYLRYVVIAVMLGCAGGLAISYGYLQEKVFHLAYRNAFISSRFSPIVEWDKVLVLFALELFLMCMSAKMACRQMLRKNAIELLGSEIRGTASHRHSGEKHLPLTLAMTLRNLRGNPQIMITTLVCVFGCTSILIGALTVRFGISGTAPRQYEQLQSYAGTLTIDGDAPERETLSEMLAQDRNVSSLRLTEHLVSYLTAQGTQYATLICFDAASDYKSFLTVQDAWTQQSLAVAEDGVMICKKISEEFSLHPGDTLLITDEQGGEYPAKITAVFDRNIGMAVLTSTEYYRTLTGTEPSQNRFYLKGDPAEINALLSRVRESPAYCCYEDAESFRAEMERKVGDVNGVILLIVCMTAAMSLFVLINLTQMNIRKKEKEIKVMKVLGFPMHRICGYVFWEAMVMCVIGLMLAALFGAVVGSAMVQVMEMENLQYIRGANPTACAVGVGVNLTFAVCANLLSLGGVRGIPMIGSAREA